MLDPQGHEPEKGPRGSFNDFAAKLAMSNHRDDCVCGGNKGHAGWIVCVQNWEPSNA